MVVNARYTDMIHLLKREIRIFQVRHDDQIHDSVSRNYRQMKNESENELETGPKKK